MRKRLVFSLVAALIASAFTTPTQAAKQSATHSAPERKTASASATSHRTESVARGNNQVHTAAGLTYTYDADGNRVKSAAPNGRITTTTYDALNRPHLTTYEGAGQTEIATATRYYDGNGNMVRVNEARGDGKVRLEVRRYDTFDRLEYVKDVHDRELTYRYDDVGNRTHLLDHEVQETVWSYNALNQNARVYIPGLRHHPTNTQILLYRE